MSYRNLRPVPYPNHIDQVQRLSYGGCWVEPMPAPRVFGVARLSDWAVGVKVGDALVEREVSHAGAPEELDQLVLRAARQLGTSQVFTLIYYPTPRTSG